MRHRSCMWLLTMFVSCLAFVPARGQVVRGSVVDSVTSRPIGDFTVQLIDANGSSVAAALAQAGGRFTLRATRNREIDSTLAEPIERWKPRGRDSADVRRTAEKATVVLQAVADTSGRIERGTVRALRGGTSPTLAAVKSALFALAPQVDEPVAGCRLRRMILLPYRGER